MSASKQKKNRIAQQGEGLSKKAAAAAEQAQKDKSFRLKTIIAVAVIAVLVIAALVINSNLLYTKTTAVRVGSTNYSPAEVNYFYKSNFNKTYEYFYNQLGSSVSMVIDTSKPLNEQQYTEDQTWADYIFESAQGDMKQITVLYDAAVNAGYTLNDEDNASVADNVAQMQSMADTYGYPSLKAFLAAYYGKGMTVNTFTRLCEKVALATRFSQDLADKDYTDEELEAYYQAHAEDLDYYDYYLYTISNDHDSFLDLPEEDRADAARAAAEELAAADSVDDFLSKVKAFSGDESDLNKTHSTYSKMSVSCKDWVADPARKAGDTTVVESEDDVSVVMFVDFDDNNYNTVDMRHILVNVEADENGVYTEEAKAAAKEKIEGIYTDWKLIGTEEMFSTLAEEYTDDPGSQDNGGLYTDIPKGQMVSAVNDFLFAPGRAVGDTEIVYNEGSYTGYHLLYLAAENGNYRQQLAKDGKSSEDYTAAYEALAEGYEVTVCAGKKFANLV